MASYRSKEYQKRDWAFSRVGQLGTLYIVEQAHCLLIDWPANDDSARTSHELGAKYVQNKNRSPGPIQKSLAIV